MVDLSLTPNPDDRALWPMGSDADWIRGSDVANNEHPGVLAQRHQWIVPNRLFAESMVKANSELVTSIIGVLLSWRTCTVDQLRAGLSVNRTCTARCVGWESSTSASVLTKDFPGR